MRLLTVLCIGIFTAVGVNAGAQDDTWLQVASVQPKQSTPTVTRFGATRNDWHWLGKAYPEREKFAIRQIVDEVGRHAEVARAVVLGCTPNLDTLAGIPILQGRFLSAAEHLRSENICVLSRSLSTAMSASIGDSVRLSGSYYTVVGICGDPKLPLARHEDFSNAFRPRRGEKAELPMVIIPISTMKARIGDLEVTRRAGSFNARRFELSQIWIRGATASRVIAVLRSSRTDDEPTNDWTIQIHRGF